MRQSAVRPKEKDKGLSSRAEKEWQGEIQEGKAQESVFKGLGGGRLGVRKLTHFMFVPE